MTTTSESTGVDQDADRLMASDGAESTEQHTTFLGKTIPRRTFLAGTAAIGAAAVVSPHVGLAGAAATKPVVKALSTSDSVPAGQVRVKEQVYDQVCTNNCWQGCHVEAHVRDGRLVKTAMNPFPEPRYNRICLRGLSHAQWTYNPARLKFPMKRVGPRGSGKWERISWDEAVSTIANSMSSIRDRYGSKAFAILSGSGNGAAVGGYGVSTLAAAFGATSPASGVDKAFTLGGFQVGLGTSWLGGNESLDLANADLLVIWGNNLTEAQVQEWHFVADAMDRGASLVVIDPNFSITASKATKWIPLRPGSDPAFALSLIHVLINENLYDEAFVTAHTTLPFLVRQDDGMFLRAGDGTTILAWDQASGGPLPADQVTAPALTGTFEANGVTVQPAFQLLADRVADWSPEQAEHYTEVDPADVRWLARSYAATKKSFIFPSMGVDRWWNANMTGRAVTTMAALTHNFGQSGAGLGVLGASLATPKDAPPPVPAVDSPPLMAIYDAIDTGKTKILVPLDGKNPANGLAKDPVEVSWPIKGIWFTKSNAASNGQQAKRFRKLIQDESKLELVVVSDSMPTDTVRLADIVLPVTHWFENDDIVSALAHPYIFRTEKALDPPFETKSDYHAFGLVADKLGFGQYYTKSEREIADDIMVATAAKLGPAGATILDTYQKTGAVRLTTPIAVGNTSDVFATPTGRLEPYSERVIVTYPSGGSIPTSAGIDPLPQWQTPIQAWPDNPLHKKYPLVYMQEHSRWRVHTTWFDAPWLRELNPEPYVEISSVDARARGIKNGDQVELFNDNGKTVAVARVSGKMRSGIVNLPKGFQRFQTKGDTGFSDLTNNWVNQITMNGSYFDNLVEVRKVEV